MPSYVVSSVVCLCFPSFEDEDSYFYVQCCVACRNHFLLRCFLDGKPWSLNCKIIAETPNFSFLFFNLQAEIFQEFSVQEEPVMFRISLSVLLDCLTIFGTSSLPGVVYFHESTGGCVGAAGCVLTWRGVIPWQLSGHFCPCCSSALSSSFLYRFGCCWPKHLNQVC